MFPDVVNAPAESPTSIGVCFFQGWRMPRATSLRPQLWVQDVPTIKSNGVSARWAQYQASPIKALHVAREKMHSLK